MNCQIHKLAIERSLEIVNNLCKFIYHDDNDELQRVRKHTKETIHYLLDLDLFDNESPAVR